MYRSDNNQHQDCQKGKSSFHCIYCRKYQCLKCNKHVYDHHKSVCCDKRDRWILVGCAKITEQEYKKMTQTNVSDIWFCSPCLDFPFNALNNSKLSSLYIQKNKNTTLKLDINRFEKMCSVCCHKLNRPLEGIPCTTCKSLVHRQCSQLKISEIPEVLKTKEKIENWECPSCKKAKFPFCDLDNLAIEKEVLNSSFPCKCSCDTNFTIERGKVYIQI